MFLLLVVIKLEGGADSDLAVLDCPPTPPPERRRSSSNPLMSPHGDDMADLSADGKKQETSDTSTGPPAQAQTGKDNNIGNLIVYSGLDGFSNCSIHYSIWNGEQVMIIFYTKQLQPSNQSQTPLT